MDLVRHLYLFVQICNTRPPGICTAARAFTNEDVYNDRQGRVVKVLSSKVRVVLLDGPEKNNEKDFSYDNIVIKAEVRPPGWRNPSDFSTKRLGWGPRRFVNTLPQPGC